MTYTHLTQAERYPIRTEADYQAALQLVAPYFDSEPEPDSDAGAHFEAMVTLIQAYECRRRLKVDPPCRLNIDPGRVATF